MIVFLSICFGLILGFIIGWHLRAVILARTILKHYFDTNYTKENNVLYIEKYRGKLK